VNLIGRLTAENPRITCGLHPDLRDEDYSMLGCHLRMSLDFLRFQDPCYRTSPALVRRADTWLPTSPVRRALKASARMRRVADRALRSAQRATPVSPTALAALHEQQPDVVLVTPLVEPGSIQSEYLRAAKQLAIPTCLCVSSWDNLTSKGLIHELPDAVVVWNEAQRSEAVRLHGVPSDRVIVTGAASYDHWFGWKPSRSREKFCAAAGIDPDRSFVLYVGSSRMIAPDESTFVREWLHGLADHNLGDIQVLARPHPLNPLAGLGPAPKPPASSPGGLTLFPAVPTDPTDRQSREDYYDSLFYCAGVVGVNTSAFLEAAIVGRPVFTLLTRRYQEGQAGQPHFHHLLTAGGGLLNVARDPREHAEQLRGALAAPHGRSCHRSTRFTESFIRPYGLDEPATPRVVAAVESVRASGPPKRRRAGALGPALAEIGVLAERYCYRSGFASNRLQEAAQDLARGVGDSVQEDDLDAKLMARRDFLLGQSPTPI
jgi:hypothetical protein